MATTRKRDMTPAQQRVAIARDALEWLKAGALVAKEGTYLRARRSLFGKVPEYSQLRDAGPAGSGWGAGAQARDAHRAGASYTAAGPARMGIAKPFAARPGRARRGAARQVKATQRHGGGKE